MHQQLWLVNSKLALISYLRHMGCCSTSVHALGVAQLTSLYDGAALKERAKHVYWLLTGFETLCNGTAVFYLCLSLRAFFGPAVA